MTTNMLKAFRRPQCGFFDDSMPNGGPDPNPHLRPNGKERNRRSPRSDKMLQYAKGKPLLGLSQVLLGYRYWSERYINECSGQRKFNYVPYRTQKLVRMVKYSLSFKFCSQTNIFLTSSYDSNYVSLPYQKISWQRVYWATVMILQKTVILFDI